MSCAIVPAYVTWFQHIPLITRKNPSLLRTLTANRNTNPNPMDSRITYSNPITLLTLWIFFLRLSVLVLTWSASFEWHCLMSCQIQHAGYWTGASVCLCVCRLCLRRSSVCWWWRHRDVTGRGACLSFSQLVNNAGTLCWRLVRLVVNITVAASVLEFFCIIDHSLAVSVK